TLLLRVRGGEEQSAHGLEFSGEAQLAVELARPAAPTPSSAAGPNLPGGDEDSERNGEVEPSALLGEIGGGEIHRNPARGKFGARVEERRAHPLLAALHHRRGQAHDAG